MAFIGPFYILKTNARKEDIFIDVKNEKRIGMKYKMELHLLFMGAERIDYTLPLIQFIVDNEATICLPFINEVEYAKYVEGK